MASVCSMVFLPTAFTVSEGETLFTVLLLFFTRAQMLYFGMLTNLPQVF